MPLDFAFDFLNFKTFDHIAFLDSAIGWNHRQGICIDTGHRNLCGDPVDALRIAGSHLITLHIQDNHGEQDEHLLPDLGQIDWTGVSQALKDIDYQGVFMYELIRPEDLAAVYPNFRSIL